MWPRDGGLVQSTEAACRTPPHSLFAAASREWYQVCLEGFRRVVPQVAAEKDDILGSACAFLVPTKFRKGVLQVNLAPRLSLRIPAPLGPRPLAPLALRPSPRHATLCLTRLATPHHATPCLSARLAMPPALPLLCKPHELFAQFRRAPLIIPSPTPAASDAARPGWLNCLCCRSCSLHHIWRCTADFRAD